MVNSSGVGKDIVVERRYGSVIKQIRSAIADAELEVAAEFDLDGGLRERFDGRKCHLLLVDCPLTDFEVLTMDEAAAVFLPVHILVSGEGNRTRVFWADVPTLLHARLPAGAAAPLQRLEARLSWALQAISEAG